MYSLLHAGEFLTLPGIKGLQFAILPFTWKLRLRLGWSFSCLPPRPPSQKSDIATVALELNSIHSTRFATFNCCFFLSILILSFLIPASLK